MNFAQYQEEALKTDKTDSDSQNGTIIPLLGLASESGELLNQYKKYLRDGDAHANFRERVQEELGDLLWYLSNTASKFNIALDDIARNNLLKCRSRWQQREGDLLGLVFVNSFDYDYPENERLPRKFEVTLTEIVESNKVKMKCFLNGTQAGSDLTDNAYVSDGYRFHDVFHFAYAAVLAWSPITRYVLKCKRKSNAITDEVEDGGRAAVIEEGISAMVFSYASQHNFLEGTSTVDSNLLRTVRAMTAGLEVNRCATGDWEKAILHGFEVWREVERNKGGTIFADLDARSLTYSPKRSV
jgi:NTP pyrophosphatase (non-canonical NTP hydrolase)